MSRSGKVNDASWRAAVAPLVGAGRARLRPRGVTGSSPGWSLLPNGTSPRLLLPLDRVPATAALRSYRATATSSTTALLVLETAARVGVARRALPSLQIDGPHQPLDEWLSDLLGQPVVSAVRLGPARANQKPVLHLMTPRGQTVGFGKVGVNDLTDRLVMNEVRALQHITQKPDSRLRAPSLLCHVVRHGHPVMVATAVPSGHGGPLSATDLRPTLEAVAGLGQQRVTTLAATAWWHRLRERVSQLPSSSTSSRLQGLVDDVTVLAGSRTVLTGAVHGDFTPWNLSRGDVTSVWDWERFEPDGLAGLDAAHFLVQRWVVEDHVAPADAAARLTEAAGAELRPWGTSSEQADLVAVAHLLDIATRYVADRQSEAGARLGDVDSWALPAVVHAVAGWARPGSRAP